MDIFQLWVNSITNPSTRRQYGNELWLLLTKVGLTPEEALNKIKAESKANDASTYSQLVQFAKGNFTKHTAYTMVMALRRFLFDNGVVLLPPSRMNMPGKVKPATSMTWEQANRICDAASRPYNLLLKMMLLCGWGIHEFATFNTQASWTGIKSYLAANPNAEYCRFNFSGRKKSTHEWFTLIPVGIIREILANVTVPLQTATGLILNMDRYTDTQKYLGSAFNTALKRAPVQFQQKPTVHEMRDCFRTRGIFVGCSDAVAEFALGHLPDKMGYKKAFTDEPFTWTELKKIYGPTAVTPTELEARDKKIEELEATVKDLTNLVAQKLGMYVVNCAKCRRELGPEDDLDNFKCECGSRKYVETPIRGPVGLMREAPLKPLKAKLLRTKPR